MNTAVFSSLPDFIDRIAQANCKDALYRALQQTLAHLGFNSFNFGCHKADKYELVLNPTLASWSSEFMEKYRCNRFVETDPILDRATKAEKPFVWSVNDEYKAQGHQDYLAFLRQTPLKGGVVIPLPRRIGTISSISAEFHEERLVTEDIINAAEIVAQFALLKCELLGLCASLEDAETKHKLSVLSSQQIEIMNWVSEGKTNAEIAVIMSVSERAIKYHIGEILRKLDATSRAKAAQLFGQFDHRTS